MKTGFASCAKYFAISSLLIGTLSAGAQQTPTVILPTSATAPNGIAPNGIGATPSELLFSEPYCVYSGISQPRAILSATNLAANGATWKADVGSTSIPIPDNGCAENYFVISPGLGGFPAGSVYATNPSGATKQDVIYKDGGPFGTAGTFVTDNFPGHAGITFDTVGTFGYALIVTTPNAVYGFGPSGGTPLFTIPAPSSTSLLESSTVAPISNVACSGCLYVTSDEETAPGGEIYTVASSSSPLVPLTAVPGPGVEPENILFVTPQVCTYGNTNFAYFVSAYAAGGDIDHYPSTSGALLAFTQTQLQGYLGQALIPMETNGPIFAFNPSTKGFSTFSTPVPIPATNPSQYQLEGATMVTCAPATGCPATQGFWKHHAMATPTMSIAGISYTNAELVSILDTAPKGGDATLILVHQLIAALANEAAGAKTGVIEDGVNVDLAITEANSLLETGLPQAGFPGSNPAGVVFPINLHNSTGTFVQSGSTLGGYFTTLSNVLNDYNSAVGLNCSEGAGLK
jgi:hypothetical protein